jgi:hypothetical protein
MANDKKEEILFLGYLKQKILFVGLGNTLKGEKA